MSNAGKTLIAIATYNEIDNLPKLVDEIFRYVPDADVLVIDDNSPDGTGGWCDNGGGGSAAALRASRRENRGWARRSWPA